MSCPQERGSGIPQRSLRQPSAGNRPGRPSQQTSGLRPPNICPSQQSQASRCPQPQPPPSGIRSQNVCPPQQMRSTQQGSGIRPPGPRQSGVRPPSSYPSQQQQQPLPPCMRPTPQTSRQSVCPSARPSGMRPPCAQAQPPANKCSDPNVTKTCRTEIDPVTGQKKIIRTTKTVKKGTISSGGSAYSQGGIEEIKPPPVPPPSQVSEMYKQNYEDLMYDVNLNPSKPAKAVCNKVSEVCPPVVMTPCGPKQAVQQMIMEHRVERGLTGEHVSKHLTGIDVDECTGKAKQVEINVQHMDPKNRLRTGDLKEIISTTSSVTVTPSHTQATKNVLREIQSIDLGLGLNQQQVQQLVDEETEDVENTMKILPPDLLESTPERYSLKKRLQNLRLNSESIALLEQSVCHPQPTADEEQAETPPEVLATIMFSVEKGVSPKKPPNQIFNALFADTKDKDYMIVSSVAPGPLQDVVVPTEVATDIFKEAMDHNMDESISLVASTKEKPKNDSFVEKKPAAPKPPAKRRKPREPKPVGEETPPWNDADYVPIQEITGAIPIENLSAIDPSKFTPNEMLNEMANGIEYFIDAPATEYVSRIQLRGSVPPTWFPGYMVALPNLAEIVKVSKSPSEVMLDAWRSVQPKIFPDDTIATVDFI